MSHFFGEYIGSFFIPFCNLIDDNFYKTGLHESMLNFLNILDLKGEERISSLILDEVHLREFLSYNQKQDCVDGIADLSDMTSLVSPKKPAKSALTFLLNSVVKSLKIPLCYYFSSTSVSGTQLKLIVFDIISKLLKIGIEIRFIICDQGATNQSLAHQLGITPEKPFFEFSSSQSVMQIFFIFDIPHIFKSIRNNFMKY